MDSDGKILVSCKNFTAVLDKYRIYCIYCLFPTMMYLPAYKYLYLYFVHKISSSCLNINYVNCYVNFYKLIT